MINIDELWSSIGDIEDYRGAHIIINGMLIKLDNLAFNTNRDDCLSIFYVAPPSSIEIMRIKLSDIKSIQICDGSGGGYLELFEWWEDNNV